MKFLWRCSLRFLASVTSGRVDARQGRPENRSQRRFRATRSSGKAARVRPAGVKTVSLARAPEVKRSLVRSHSASSRDTRFSAVLPYLLKSVIFVAMSSGVLGRATSIVPPFQAVSLPSMFNVI